MCATQTSRFNQELAALGDSVNAVTVSCDLPFAQARFCGAEEIGNMRTGSDYRERSFGADWGTLINELKILARAVYVLDADGKVAYAQLVPEVTEEPDLRGCPGRAQGPAVAAASGALCACLRVADAGQQIHRVQRLLAAVLGALAQPGGQAAVDRLGLVQEPVLVRVRGREAHRPRQRVFEHLRRRRHVVGLIPGGHSARFRHPHGEPGRTVGRTLQGDPPLAADDLGGLG